jgi:hypothetical protein
VELIALLGVIEVLEIDLPIVRINGDSCHCCD